MVKEIILSQGKIAFVDDSDYEFLNNFKWCAHKAKKTFYAVRRKNVVMHTCIMSTPEGLEVDHIDGDGLNNQRSNLRVVSRRVNSQNLHFKKLDNPVGLQYKNNKWCVRIMICKKRVCLGSYDSKEEASYIYDLASSLV